ncbi:MAG: 50S ribosomal protein L19, partial [Sphingomicrobium sp.]
VRRGRVRRAKLYYLRGRTGKSARIAERRDPRHEAAKAEAKAARAAEASAAKAAAAKAPAKEKAPATEE